MAENTYTQIGFNDLLQRDDSLVYVLGTISGYQGITQGITSATANYNGSVEEATVKSDGAMADLWIINTIRSTNWKPQKTGFYMDGGTGYAEFADVYISGAIVATTGTIGGFTIGATTISGGTSLVLSSTGTGTITGGTIQTTSSGARVEIKSDSGTYRLSIRDSSDNIVSTIGQGGPAGYGLIRVTSQVSTDFGIVVTMQSNAEAHCLYLTNPSTVASSSAITIADGGATGIIISGASSKGINITHTGTDQAIYVSSSGSAAAAIYAVGVDYPAFEAYHNGTSSNSYGIKITTGTNALKSSFYINNIADSNLPFGIHVNRVASSVSDVVALKIDASNSGAGKSYAIQIGAGGSLNVGIDMSLLTTKAYFKVAPDATDPTGGGGAATGRIPILIGSTTYYLAYY